MLCDKPGKLGIRTIICKTVGCGSISFSGITSWATLGNPGTSLRCLS